MAESPPPLLESLVQRDLYVVIHASTDGQYLWLELRHDPITFWPSYHSLMISGKRLHATGVDFQMTLQELVTQAHQTFNAPDSLAEWTFLGRFTWAFKLLAASEGYPLR